MQKLASFESLQHRFLFQAIQPFPKVLFHLKLQFHFQLNRRTRGIKLLGSIVTRTRIEPLNYYEIEPNSIRPVVSFSKFPLASSATISCPNLTTSLKLSCTFSKCRIEVDRKEKHGRSYERKLTLVARKPSFGLPTACPKCLPAYIYLRLAKVPFDLDFNLLDPDSEQIPYVESEDYVAYNNEKGGVIEGLKDDGVVDLDSRVEFDPDWLSTNAMITSWLSDAVMYELWVASDESPVHKIYYSDLAWPIGKIMFLKQVRVVKQLLGINSDNVDRREAEIYRRATRAYKALSTKLGDETFFFDNRPTSVDANFLAHALFTLQALPETSTLRSKLLEYSNIMSYAEKLRKEFVDPDPNGSSVPQPLSGSSSSDPKGSRSSWRSKPKSKPKKEKTEEEKTFRRRAKYFLGAQVVAVLVFLTLMAGGDDGEVELDEDDDFSYNY